MKGRTRRDTNCIIRSPSLHSYLCLGRSSFDQYDIAIHNLVVLALGHHLTRSLHSCFITRLFQGLKVVYYTLDEGLLKICESQN